MIQAGYPHKEYGDIQNILQLYLLKLFSNESYRVALKKGNIPQPQV